MNKIESNVEKIRKGELKNMLLLLTLSIIELLILKASELNQISTQIHFPMLVLFAGSTFYLFSKNLELSNTARRPFEIDSDQNEDRDLALSRMFKK